MKRITLLLSAAILLLCTTTCNSEENKGRFAKNIPVCVKERIRENKEVCCVDEYCNIGDIKKIYIFFDHFTLPYITMGFNEDCKFFFIKQEGSPWIALNPEGFVLPDETIEYKEDIYHFKRTVFKQK